MRLLLTLIVLAIVLFPSTAYDADGFWHAVVVVKNEALGDSSEMVLRWYDVKKEGQR